MERNHTHTHTPSTSYSKENLTEPFEAINLHKVSIFHSDCVVATDFTHFISYKFLLYDFFFKS